MTIENCEGGMTITGRGDMPKGSMSFFTLLSAFQAAKIHVESNGSLKLAPNATPKNLVIVLNQHYPNRPDGPFKARTMKTLMTEVAAEIERQKALILASDRNAQIEAIDRILSES